MKRILVPIDFSFNAEKALEYALHLSVYFSSEIILFHSWELPHQKSAMFASMQDMVRKKAENDINALKDKISDRFPELKLKTALMMGDPGDTIKTAAKKLQADFIIMGTKGASGLTKYFFGSIASAVIEDAPCPVFAVPEKAQYQNIIKIGYATDYNEDDLQMSLNLVPLAKLFNAELIIAHIGKEKGPDENGTKRLANAISRLTSYRNIKPMFIEENDVLKGINKLIEEENLNILAIAKIKRDFFGGLFHKSISQEIAFSSTIPLIVFQSSKDAIDIEISDKGDFSSK
jgi:nucleotide-binding universal stress UspA family protein